MLTTVQFEFEVISTVFVLLKGAAIETEFDETFKTGVAPACVTVIVFEVTPVPETVTVADLVDVVGLTADVKVIGELPVPLAALSVIHV